MSTDYYSRHFQAWRDVIETAIEELDPHTMTVDAYVAALIHFDRYDTERFPGKPPRLFAMCPDCAGDGRERNPKWEDTDENQEPEVIDCEQCRGTGMVEIIDELPTVAAAPALDDDMPF
jgi:hypothetical protein